MYLRNVVLAGLAAAALMAAAEASYFGKWKLDAAKSDFGDTTFTVSQTPAGDMQYSADGQTYTFKIDGSEYPALFGDTAAWKSIDANTWEVTNKLNGKLLGTDTYKLAADGQSLTVNSKGPKPAGGTFDDTITFQRIFGTSGIIGKWKTKNFKSSAPDVMEFVAAGADGMAFNIIDQQAVCNLKFDDMDYPITGPTMPPNMTLAIKKSGARAFDATVKLGGKALYRSTFTVSSNGKTLTETGSAVATGEKYKAVFDRQ
jgi:hypothetical protein